MTSYTCTDCNVPAERNGVHARLGHLVLEDAPPVLPAPTPCAVCSAPAAVLVMIVDPTAWGTLEDVHSTCLAAGSARCAPCLRGTAQLLAEEAAGVAPCTLLRTLIVTPLAVTL